MEKAIFEIRYSPSFLVWDHIGNMWTEAASKWPGLKNMQAQPNLTSFQIDDSHEVGIAINKASVTGHNPKPDLAEVIEKIVFFVEAIVRHLKVSQFLRIGARLIYFREYPSEAAASEAMLASKVLPLPEGPHFGIEGAYNLPEYAVRWEGKTAGVTIRLRTEGRKTEFEPPLGAIGLKPIHEEKFGVVVDLDYFTKGTITSGQFRAQDWMANVLHVFKRDTSKFLGV